ncbi:hypothetical protein [Agathobaculum sp.]|uniref:hypothetical protein n=1 Tax=Agathobaculum sp. TaxID=2048138 RepID=UPI002A82E772|nr:hypothetical protein [Agathobaculum sp.]MDY3617732.1 hypothetical protein [Agathobaculum sp.]
MKTSKKRIVLALALILCTSFSAFAATPLSRNSQIAPASPRYVNIISVSAGLGNGGGQLEADTGFALYSTHKYIVESVVKSTDGSVQQTKSAYGTASASSAQTVQLYFSVPKNKTYKHTATLKVLDSSGNVIEQTSVTSASYLYG